MTTFRLAALILLALAVCACARPAFAQAASRDLSSAGGVAWQFKPENGDWTTIAVPGGGWKPQGFTCDAGTYRATITLPKFGPDKIAQVVFQGINFGGEVSVGPDEAHQSVVAAHTDGWVPVTADITHAVAPGQTVLLMVAVKGRAKYKVNGRYTVPEGATWDPYLEDGIIRGVRLDILPRVHVADAFARTSVRAKTLHPVVTIANASDHDRTITVAANVSSGDARLFAYPPIPARTTTIPANGTKTVDLGSIAWNLGPKSYWWPNVPYTPGYRAQMHVLTVTLLERGHAVQTKSVRFGFRQFEAQGAHYYLNGIRCNLRGDNLQEADFLTDAYGVRPGFGPPSPGNPGWPKAVDNLERLNFNVMRIHQVPATPYMLGACDEMGLMLVEESPLRGSEGGEDYQGGKENMLNMDRELVLRDRNHPAVVIWSAANEWSDPIKDATAAILALDDTRPVIADGVGDLGAPYINMQHYVNGIDGYPSSGAAPRTDRPYGETEAIWDGDNTLQGFAWMATSVRLRRLLGDADLRNYTLNNAWPNFVPGESPANEICEKHVKHMGGDETILPALESPWTNPNIRLMQACYNPLAVCDVEFDRRNGFSNDHGDWPIIQPRLQAGQIATRQLAIFNDCLAPSAMTVRWCVHVGSSATGRVLASGSLPVSVPPGEFVTREIAFTAPATPGLVTLAVTNTLDGVVRFSEDRMTFRVVVGSSALIPDGDYLLVNHASGTVADASGKTADQNVELVGHRKSGGDSQRIHVTNLGGDDITLTNPATGLAVTVASGSLDKNADIVLAPAANEDDQIWHVEELGGGYYCLTNKHSGKALDLNGGYATDGTRIIQWDVSRNMNQQWQFVAVK